MAETTVNSRCESTVPNGKTNLQDFKGMNLGYTDSSKNLQRRGAEKQLSTIYILFSLYIVPACVHLGIRLCSTFFISFLSLLLFCPSSSLSLSDSLPPSQSAMNTWKSFVGEPGNATGNRSLDP